MEATTDATIDTATAATIKATIKAVAEVDSLFIFRRMPAMNLKCPARSDTRGGLMAVSMRPALCVAKFACFRGPFES